MNAEGHTVACLTGEFQGSQRDIIIDSFRNGQSKVLITTNVLSRGIDVQTVSLVVNYVSLPWLSYSQMCSYLARNHFSPCKQIAQQ